MNFLENKIGLVQYTLLFKSTPNSITTSLNIYKKLCDLDRDLKQIAFKLLNTKITPSRLYYYRTYKPEINTIATLKSQNVISLYQCKTVQSPLYVLKDQCFERIPTYYQNKVQFVDQVTRKKFPCSIKPPWKSDNFDQHISLDVDGENTYRLTPYPFTAHNPVKVFTPTEVDNHLTHAEFTAQQLGIYSQHDWTKSVDKMRFNQLVDDAAEKLEVARAVNFADLAKQAQLQARFSRLSTENNDYFNNLFINGKEFTLGRLDFQDLINGTYLKESLIGIFGYPWYVLKEIAIIWNF